jgi:hypothetical protein
MSRSDLLQWLQVSANLAILAGVVLVVLQMRQNADLLELQILKQDADSYIAAELALIGENYTETWQKMLEEPENLTLAEKRALESILWAHMIKRWVNTYKLAQQGLIEDIEWKHAVDSDVGYELAHPYGKAWWKEAREISMIPRQLAEYVDSKLETGVSPVEYYEKLDEHLRKYESR